MYGVWDLGPDSESNFCAASVDSFEGRLSNDVSEAAMTLPSKEIKNHDDFSGAVYNTAPQDHNEHTSTKRESKVWL